ncbi:alpha/beta fold hydrolase [Streptomyces sp. NPDC056534]|uniref:alpha/beta hydrolase family protein n=1 Tax=Streptomyces sp. NPDC056534 TaxID=3345857 RepID=UPI00369D4500
MTHTQAVQIDAPGGGRLAAVVTRPASQPAAAVLLCPALGVPAQYYAPFCRHLAELGVAVVAADLRGQGASTPRAGRAARHGYHVLASQDLPAWVAWTKKSLGPSTPLYVLGHSLGGQVSVHYSALAMGGVDGLVLVAAGSVDYRGFSGASRLKVLLGTHAAASIATLVGYWPGHLLGFAGRQPARLMRDWARIARTGRFFPEKADIDYEALLADVRLPTLAVSLAGDTLAPPDAVDRLCAKIPASDVERWHYEPEEESKADHIRWARDGREIAARVQAWTTSRGKLTQQGLPGDE